jgi:hypothetical protein
MPGSSQLPQQRHTAEYISLRDYIDTRLEAVEKTTELSRIAMEKRLDGMNEFRATLQDQNRNFVPRQEYSAFVEKAELDLRSLRESRSKLEGKADASSLHETTIIAVIGLLIALVSLLIRIMEIA